jgi:hypothetical protein
MVRLILQAIVDVFMMQLSVPPVVLLIESILVSNALDNQYAVQFLAFLRTLGKC